MRSFAAVRISIPTRLNSVFFGSLLTVACLAGGSAQAAQSWLDTGAELIDRKFPSSWCPYQFVSFTALDTRATLVFEAQNLDFFGDVYDHRLDNLMVVERTTWDAFNALPIWLNGSCNCFGEDPQFTIDFDQYFASSGADSAMIPYLELFDSDPTSGSDTPWTLSAGASYDAATGGSAPNPPYDFDDIDPASGSLALNLGQDVAGSISAQVAIDGLVVGNEYVVAGWWSVVFGGSCEVAESPLSIDVVGESSTSAPGTEGLARTLVRIEGAHPNPFSDRTRVQLRLPPGDRGELRVYDVAGRLVRRFTVHDDGGGSGSVIWDGKDQAGGNVASGTYLLRLITRAGESSLRMALLR